MPQVTHSQISIYSHTQRLGDEATVYSFSQQIINIITMTYFDPFLFNYTNCLHLTRTREHYNKLFRYSFRIRTMAPDQRRAEQTTRVVEELHAVLGNSYSTTNISRSSNEAFTEVHRHEFKRKYSTMCVQQQFALVFSRCSTP